LRDGMPARAWRRAVIGRCHFAATLLTYRARGATRRHAAPRGATRRRQQACHAKWLRRCVITSYHF
ncbi:hypothetical protein VWT76_23685, partial [Xanthomonas citri pv. citri]